MTISSARPRSELRLGAAPILMAAALVGLGLVIAAELGIGAAVRSQLHMLALSLYGLAGIAWLLETLRPGWGTWCAALGAVGIILASNTILQTEGLLALTVVPVIVLFTAHGLGAGFIVTSIATLVLALLAKQANDATTSGAVAVAAIALWGTFLPLAALHARVAQLDLWLDEYLQRAREVVAESRERKAELAQALDDLTHLNRQMALMTQRQASLRKAAEQAETAKAAYLARVSHEFRTPLNIIIGMVDLIVGSPTMRSERLPEDLVEHLRIVHRNCQHLASMVDDVLDLSRIEAERMSLNRTWVDVPQLIDTSVQVVQPLIAEKKLALSVHCPPHTPKIYCDRIRIRQVLLNLLSNAARATERGSIDVEVELRAESLLLSVSDTGPGIPGEVAQTIFEPFVQGGKTSNGTVKGSGLGLSISKQFVEMHGGRMWVETESGEGTAFYVELPRGPQREHVARPGHQNQEEWVWRERTSRPKLPETHLRPRVVLCDVTGELAQSIPRLRDDLEFVSLPEPSLAGSEICALAASAIVANHVSAEELCTLLGKVSEAAPDVPVIGWVCPPRLRRARQMGALAYLVKPINRQSVEQAIRSLPSPPETVLIVEDDIDTQELMKMMLHSIEEQMHVIVSGTSREALDRMRVEPPDLVLLDIVLPDLSGWELLAQMQRDEDLRSIPAVVISGQDPSDEKLGSAWLVALAPRPLALDRLLDHSIRIAEMLNATVSGPEQRHL